MIEPIEPSYRKTNLTKAQVREQVEALYGEKKTMNVDVNNLNTRDLASLESLIAQLKSKEGGTAGLKEFDLNKPPVPPYRYQHFPRMLYKFAEGEVETCIAHTNEEEQSLFASGWTENPSGKLPAAPAPVDTPKTRRRGE
jgi:hypothetical protein